MTIEWDDKKRQANIRKHGIDFVEVDSVFHDYTVTMEDDRFDYGERRFVTLGLLHGRVVVVVHTEDNDTIRIISMRKATKHEQRRYFSAIQN